MSDNLPERVQILCHAHIICITVLYWEDASHFLLNCRLYIEQSTVLFNFLHHHNFQRDIRTLLFGDSKKNQTHMKYYVVYPQLRNEPEF
jgi:hypothetical protein